jgi:hypothetical protein
VHCLGSCNRFFFFSFHATRIHLELLQLLRQSASLAERRNWTGGYTGISSGISSKYRVHGPLIHQREQHDLKRENQSKQGQKTPKELWETQKKTQDERTVFGGRGCSNNRRGGRKSRWRTAKMCCAGGAVLPGTRDVDRGDLEHMFESRHLLLAGHWKGVARLPFCLSLCCPQNYIWGDFPKYSLLRARHYIHLVVNCNQSFFFFFNTTLQPRGDSCIDNDEPNFDE